MSPRMPGGLRLPARATDYLGRPAYRRAHRRPFEPAASCLRDAWCAARSWSRGESALPDEPPCDHHALSLHLRRPAELAHEGLRDQAVRRLGDLNPTRLPGGLHTGRRVHRVSPDVEHELSPSDDATDHRPRV